MSATRQTSIPTIGTLERDRSEGPNWLLFSEILCIVDLHIDSPQVRGWFPTQSPRELPLADALKRARMWAHAISHATHRARNAMASGVRVRTIATAANELGVVLYCATHEGNDPNGPAGSIPVGVTKKPKRKTKRKIAR